MQTLRFTLYLFVVAAILPFASASAKMSSYSFGTAGEFIGTCEGSSPPEECLNAVMYVEQVIDGGDSPNATCDGGPSELLKATTNEQLDAALREKVVKIVPWLKAHPEYGNQSYGDGIWAALKGVYCR